MKNKKEKRIQFFIGVNPLVARKNKLLLGKRKNVFGDNTWGLPGGHLEFNETIEKCAERELFEETNIRCKTFIISNIISQFREDDKYYLQIGVEAKNIKGSPIIMEPHKCHELKWFDFDKLPKNIFRYHKKQIQVFLKNKKLK
ncbi:MAG: NUDIX domain-containing protein [Candidatus Paceibacterota bacterium]